MTVTKKLKLGSSIVVCVAVWEAVFVGAMYLSQGFGRFVRLLLLVVLGFPLMPGLALSAVIAVVRHQHIPSPLASFGCNVVFYLALVFVIAKYNANARL